ncbi:Threonine dehydratase [Spironucleus salmonicida]|uniref:Threonine dehydratase n=1 Tax=Spironucleus salmonicida TaxID=348837 RepID=A0A9P8LW34_9EUKA|nr:Threonine dehydratase [Spironucleus salmonicida]
MNTFIKSYQLLSEDAGCDLHVQLSNIAGNDNIACFGYKYLLEQSLSSSVCRIEFDAFSIEHLLPLAAAAKYYDYFLFARIPETLELNVSHLFQIWGALKLGACVRQSMTDAVRIDQTNMDRALTEMTSYFMAKTVQQFADKPLKLIVMPLDTSVFSRCDFYFAIQAFFQGEKVISVVPVQQAILNQYDYLSWVQTMDLELTYGAFWNAMRTDSTVVDADVKRWFAERKVTAAGDYAFSNNILLKNAIFDGLAARFQAAPARPKGTVDVTTSERFDAFKQFIAASHSIALGSYISPIAALLSKKIYLEKTDVVLAMTCGSMLTTKQFTCFSNYLNEYIKWTLEDSYEIITFTVTCDTAVMSNTIKLMEILEALNVSIQHWRYTDSGLQIEVQSPGYQSLVKIANKVDQSFGRRSFYCEEMPDFAPCVTQAPVMDYTQSARAEATFNYQSEIAGFGDITPATIDKADRNLITSKAADVTGVVHDQYYSEIIQSNLFMVMENIQQTGSFKIRGASNMLIKAYNQAIANNQTIEGVIACSAGNHAQGVAKTANLLKIKCTIICPESAPITKLYATMRYNAEVIKYGKVFDISNKYAQELAKQRGWLFVPPFDSFDVIEGQGTIASQLYQQMDKIGEKVDTILVNVGGGGMISGISLYAKQMNKNVKIVGVQAERVFPLENYHKTGAHAKIDPTAATIADGCNVKCPGGVHNEILRTHVDDYIAVNENQVASTIVNLLLRTKTVSEGAGCMGLAALLYGKYKPQVDENVAVVICGGNIDIARLHSIYKMGLIGLGKMLKVKLIIASKTGQLGQFTRIVAKYAGTITYVRHASNEGQVTWDSSVVQFEITVPTCAATQALRQELAAQYKGSKISFPGSGLLPDAVQ